MSDLPDSDWFDYLHLQSRPEHVTVSAHGCPGNGLLVVQSDSSVCQFPGFGYQKRTVHTTGKLR